MYAIRSYYVIKGIMQPMDITQIIALNTLGSLIVSEIDKPNALAAVSAAGNSYVTAPRTLSRIHGKATPSAFDKVISPISMEMDGVILNIIEEIIVFLIVELSIPSFFP